MPRTTHARTTFNTTRALAFLVIAGCAAGVTLAGGTTSGNSSTSNDGLPGSLTLTGVVRDFKELSVTGGHPDFELNPSGGFGQYSGMVAEQLDADGKPVYASSGFKVNSQAKDAQGRQMMQPRSYMARRTGDVNASVATSAGGALRSSADFAKWFRDTPGVNVSKSLAISLVRQGTTNVYTFDDRTDTVYKNKGGFFPINGELFGNSGGSTPNQNFHFTYELDTTFVYRKNAGQVFTFTGDDDVWVYVDGKLVIDIGGIHSAVSQTIDLDRLSWLEDGKRYPLKFFFAERHRTQSNFRIETTLNLQNADLPPTSGLYD